MIGVRLVHFELGTEFDDTGERISLREWWQKRFIINVSFPWGKKYKKKPEVVKYG